MNICNYMHDDLFYQNRSELFYTVLQFILYGSSLLYMTGNGRYFGTTAIVSSMWRINIMSTGTLPRVNERLFFFDKEVIVVKVFSIFQLAEIRYACSLATFMVDIKVLRQEADKSSSISIKLLGGTDK